MGGAGCVGAVERGGGIIDVARCSCSLKSDDVGVDGGICSLKSEVEGVDGGMCVPVAVVGLGV